MRWRELDTRNRRAVRCPRQNRIYVSQEPMQRSQQANNKSDSIRFELIRVIDHLYLTSARISANTA